MASRSRRRYWHPWSQGNASRICCIVQSWLGWSVTWKCSTRRRACDKHHEDKQNPEGRRRHYEEVERGHLFHVIGQEGSPSLGWWLSRAAKISSHGRLCEVDS